MGCAGTGQHLFKRLARRAGLQPLHILGLGDAFILARETARQIAVHQNDDIILGHLGLDRVHKGAFIEPGCVIVVFHKTGHQGEVVRRLLPARIGQRQDGHVQLATRQGFVLLPRLEQGFGAENLDLEIDIGCGDFVGDDLRNLVAHVLI